MRHRRLGPRDSGGKGRKTAGQYESTVDHRSFLGEHWGTELEVPTPAWPGGCDVEVGDVQAIHFKDDGETPNNPVLPMLVYRGAFALDGERDPAVPFERAFARHGWGDGWRNGIHSFRHFHTSAHEALGIARGRATVEFGGAKLARFNTLKNSPRISRFFPSLTATILDNAAFQMAAPARPAMNCRRCIPGFLGFQGREA